MRVVMPYVYTVEHMRSRVGRKVVVGTPTRDHVVADVPELRNGEYSIVAEWQTELHGKRIRNRCLSFLGELYVPLVGEDGTPERWLPSQWTMHWPSFKSLLAVTGRAGMSDSEYRHLVSSLGSPQNHGLHLSNVRDVVGSNQSDRMARAQQSVEGIVYAEGHPWRRVPWIALKVRQVSGMACVSVETGPVGLDAQTRPIANVRSLPPHYEIFFALDELDVIGERFGQGNLIPQFAGLNLRGSAPPFDGERDHLARTMKYVLDSTCSTVGAMPASAAMEWVDMRDSYVSGDHADLSVMDMQPRLRNMLPFVADDLRYLVDEAVKSLSIHLDNAPTSAFSHRLGL